MENSNDSKLETPKLVLLTPTLDGGVGRVINLLTEGLSKKNIPSEIWTLKGGSYEEKISKYSNVKHLESQRARESVGELKKLLIVEKPEIILSISFHMNCMILLARILSKVNTKIFISEHTSLDSGFKEISFIKGLIARICMNIFYKKADHLIAISNGVAKNMAKYSGVPVESINIIYNPVITPEIFEKSREKVEHPFFQSNEPVLLAVGRISAEKDYPTLLKAIKIANETKSINLIIIGDGPDKESIEEQIKELGLAEKVSLLGHISNPYPYFVKSDLYVMSSTREGLPTTIIEALALDTPVVSTDARSGPREILKNGKYGKIVPVKDSNALANAITESIQSEKTILPKEATEPYRAEKAVENYLTVLSLNEK